MTGHGTKILNRQGREGRQGKALRQANNEMVKSSRPGIKIKIPDVGLRLRGFY
jgi:hypothetical protein